MLRHTQGASQLLSSRQQQHNDLFRVVLGKASATLNRGFQAKELFAIVRIEIFSPGMEFGADRATFVRRNSTQGKIAKAELEGFEQVRSASPRFGSFERIEQLAEEHKGEILQANVDKYKILAGAIGLLLNL